MKKTLILGLSAVLLMSSCDTYTGAGAYSGATFGSILGSAIGGLSDGPRGSDWGTIIGMAGGAAVGAAIGSATEQHRQQQRQEAIAEAREHRAEMNQRQAQRRSAQAQQQSTQQAPVTVQSQPMEQSDDNYGSGFDANNSGDDRIYDFTSSDYTGDYTAQQPTTTEPMQSSVEDLAKGMSYLPTLEVRNARFLDDNQDGQIQRGELCKIIFEVRNNGKETLYDVVPTVIEASGNRHIFISPNMHVEQIQPGKGIRYTAMVKADNSLKNGSAKFCVSVVQGGKNVSKVSEFNIPTVK